MLFKTNEVDNIYVRILKCGGTTYGNSKKHTIAIIQKIETKHTRYEHTTTYILWRNLLSGNIRLYITSHNKPNVNPLYDIIAMFRL